MGSAARLKLRQQVADVRLDRLLGEEEPLADLVDEPVGDELEQLDLAGGWPPVGARGVYECCANETEIGVGFSEPSALVQWSPRS